MRRYLVKYSIVITVLVLAAVVAGCKQEQPQSNDTQQAPPTQTQPQQPVGPPTYVTEGKTPEEHLTEYFNAYRDQDFDKAFDLQPAENKAKQTKDEFVSLRKSLPIEDYKIGEEQDLGDNKISIPVEYDIPQYGTWVSVWEFEKKGGKWIALSYRSSGKAQ